MARERESASESILATMWLEHPSKLLRQLRNDLALQVDRNRLKRTDDDVVSLGQSEKGLPELTCTAAEFRSDSRLNFKLELEKQQKGWLFKRFQFSLYLAGRNIKMVRIHLNERVSHDPVKVPLCHFHIGDSEAHIPFPIMSPRLMVHLICEHIEPDLG